MCCEEEVVAVPVVFVEDEDRGANENEQHDVETTFFTLHSVLRSKILERRFFSFLVN